MCGPLFYGKVSFQIFGLFLAECVAKNRDCLASDKMLQHTLKKSRNSISESFNPPQCLWFDPFSTFFSRSRFLQNESFFLLLILHPTFFTTPLPLNLSFLLSVPFSLSLPLSLSFTHFHFRYLSLSLFLSHTHTL